MPEPFFRDRRGRVARAAGAYVVGAWLVIQVTDVVGPALGFPAWTLGALVWSAVVGFPVLVVGAWLSGGRALRSGPRADTSLAAEAGRPPRAPAAGVPRRLIVLPFRVLRPDEETDFLSAALPDAITCSLAGLRSIIVRSSVTAARIDPTGDLRAVAEEAEVDVVLTGTLQRGGNDLEVRAQLADVGDGSVLWSMTMRGQVADLFALQDRVTRRVVESLDLPLSADERGRLGRDVPKSARAYEFYLRGNEMSVKVGKWDAALEFYEECLREDPAYAPAWAGAGRCHRLLGKYSLDRAASERQLAAARDAFARALELNPDLHVGHSFLADFEVDSGQAERAVSRLLGRLEATGHHPDVLAGLVQACRFCGLIGASSAAARLARELDPHVRTSVAHTHFMARDYGEALRTYNPADIGYMQALALVGLGRADEARERLRERESSLAEGSLIAMYVAALLHLLEGRPERSHATVMAVAPSVRDGEAIFYLARQLAFMGYPDDAIHQLRRSFAAGFFCYPALVGDPWLEAVGSLPAFVGYRDGVRERHERAADAFEVEGGPQLLRFRESGSA